VPRVAHLLETPRLVVGEFSCAADDDAWSTTNHIGDSPHVVFPLVPVGITQIDKGTVLATPNHMIFYDADQLYRRRLLSEHGDRCIFVSLDPGTLEALVQEAAPEIVDDRRQLVAIDAPVDQATYLARHLLVRRLRAGEIGARAAEADVLSLLGATLRRASPKARRRRAQTRAAHHELAEAAKGRLAASLAQPVGLETLARALHTSPFHLARVFRRETGFTVAGYRRALRLRAALEQLPARADGLSALALDLGFSSHSHFSDAFRNGFGLTPSSLK
jgi:AraC family transcriptional regulator